MTAGQVDGQPVVSPAVSTQQRLDQGPGVPVLAVDGPSGSGKSSVAKAVAEQLGWRYVDTGATYRAATVAALDAEVDLTDAAEVTAVVRRADIALSLDPAAPGVRLDGVDVSTRTRSDEVTRAVSLVARVPGVRAQLVALQRDAIGDGPAVAEGRDVASVVCPQAAVKVYLDADPAVRAARRAAENGVVESTEVAQDLGRRDAADTRTTPLQPHGEATVVDATHLTLAEVVEAVLALVTAAGLDRA